MPQGVTPHSPDGDASDGPVSRPDANASGPGGMPRVLTAFDVTNITVGAIVGADIYVMRGRISRVR